MPQQRTLQITEKHGAFKLGFTDKPSPGPGEILVKIIAAGLNPVDWKVQAGGIPVEYPVVMGRDGAGIVVEVGEGVTKLKVGDRVLHQGNSAIRNATFQEYAAIPAEIAAKIPDELSFEEAASIPSGLATAATGFYNPISTGTGLGLTPPWEGGEGKYSDQGILIIGGASSVGQYAIQLAKLSGFNPIVATASLHNADLLKSLGATHIIDRNADVAAETSDIFTASPLKIIYDAVSLTATQQVASNILTPGGALILVLPAITEIKSKGLTIVQVYGSVFAQRQLGVSMYAHLTEYLAARKIKPNKVEVLPNGLAGIADGLARMRNNKISGLKLIVKPQETP